MSVRRTIADLRVLAAHTKRRPLAGDERDRTAGLLSAIQALSQLSYIPIAAGRVNGQPRRHSTQGDRLCNQPLLIKGRMAKRVRADLVVVEQGLAPSREKARALILA